MITKFEYFLTRSPDLEKVWKVMLMAEHIFYDFAQAIATL